MADRPIRVQRSRAAGWRMPENTVYVGRPTMWGNPHDWQDWREVWKEELPGHGPFSGEVGRDDWCRDRATQSYRQDVLDGELYSVLFNVSRLRGKNLACWCPLGSPCHADVLLELANAPVCEEVA